MDKTVLITGCSSGIGRATARAFLEDEWRVYATSRDPEDVADLAEAGCETTALDVTDDEQVEATVDAIIEETGRLDCLVNNAGYGQFGPLEDVPVADLREQFDVNVHGPHRLARAVLPHMREREEGTIVNMSSVAGRVTGPGMGAYSASKAALESMSDALRAEVDVFDVDVVLVQPGPVDTGFTARAEDEMDDVDRTPAYEEVYDLFEDAAIIGGQAPFAESPEKVAEVVLEAANSPNPDPRYPVGPIAKLALKGRYLPDRWQDAGYRLLRRLQ